MTRLLFQLKSFIDNGLYDTMTIKSNTNELRVHGHSTFQRMTLLMLPPWAAITSFNLRGKEAHALIMNSSDMLFQARVIEALRSDTLE